MLQTSPAPSPPLRSAAPQAEEEAARREPCSEDILHPLRVFFSGVSACASAGPRELRTWCPSQRSQVPSKGFQAFVAVDCRFAHRRGRRAGLSRPCASAKRQRILSPDSWLFVFTAVSQECASANCAFPEHN